MKGKKTRREIADTGEIRHKDDQGGRSGVQEVANLTIMTAVILMLMAVPMFMFMSMHGVQQLDRAHAQQQERDQQKDGYRTPDHGRKPK